MKASSLFWPALAFGGAMLISVTLQGATLGQAPWYISRASGLVAFVLLSGSVILGLMISTKSASPPIPRAMAFDLHQFLAILGLTFIGIHAGALVFDGFLHFTPAQVLVPFVSAYRPLAVGAGIIAGWSAALVTASFWARKRIGYAAWRRFHYLSFGAYLLALGHGVTAGTDTSLPLVGWLYILSAGTVAALLVYRIGDRQRTPARTSRPKARGAVRPAAR